MDDSTRKAMVYGLIVIFTMAMMWGLGYKKGFNDEKQICNDFIRDYYGIGEDLTFIDDIDVNLSDDGTLITILPPNT